MKPEIINPNAGPIIGPDGLEYVSLADSTHYKTDPDLTALVIANGDQEFVGERVCPRANVPSFKFDYYRFGTESQKIFNTYRGPGQQVHVADITKSEGTGKLEHHALATPFDRVYDGVAWGTVPVDWRAEKAKVARLIAQRRLEYDISTVMRTQATYTLKGYPSTKYGSGGTPIADVDAGIDAVLGAVGIRPGQILIGFEAWQKIRRNADVTDRIKYVNPTYGAIAGVTPTMMAAIWDVREVIIGASSYLDAAGTRTYFWADDIIIKVSTPSPSVGVPAHAYTFTLPGYPTAISFSDESRMSEYSGWADSRKPIIVGNDFAYLLYDCV
jgi:hypothetical protein